MRKIALLNFKGGPGKTTSAVNIGAGLASLGKKVLLVDDDPQGNVGKALGVTPNPAPYSLAELILQKPGEVDLEKYIQPLRENLDGILSDKRLTDAIDQLANRTGRDTILSRILSKASEYDYIICDCAPGLNQLNINVLFFIDEVITPVDMDLWALDGLYGLNEKIDEINEITNIGGKEISINFVLPTKYDRRNCNSADMMDALNKLFPGKVVEPIRTNVRFSESHNARQTIFEYEAGFKDKKGSQDYMKFVQELEGIKDGQR